MPTMKRKNRNEKNEECTISERKEEKGRATTSLSLKSPIRTLKNCGIFEQHPSHSCSNIFSFQHLNYEACWLPSWVSEKGQVEATFNSISISRPDRTASAHMHYLSQDTKSSLPSSARDSGGGRPKGNLSDSFARGCSRTT